MKFIHLEYLQSDIKIHINIEQIVAVRSLLEEEKFKFGPEGSLVFTSNETFYFKENADMIFALIRQEELIQTRVEYDRRNTF